jgi:hypothetical protein
VVLASLVAPAHAQTPTGEISGIVTDPSGSAVPGVTITLTNIGTNAVREVQTNSAGLYSYTSGTVSTTLTGKYVDIVDTCGAVSESNASGGINMGGANNQHDCTSGGGSNGNSPASRTACWMSKPPSGTATCRSTV